MVDAAWEKHKAAAPPSAMTDAELNAAVIREVMSTPGALYLGGSPVPIGWNAVTDIAAAMGDVVGEMQKDTKRFAYFCQALVDMSPYIDVNDPTNDALGGIYWLLMNLTPRMLCEAALMAVRSEQ